MNFTSFMIVLLNIYIFFSKTTMQKKLIYLLLSIGLVVSHLFVEVSPRYTIHAYLVMQICAILFINNCEIFKIKKDKIKQKRMLSAGNFSDIEKKEVASENK